MNKPLVVIADPVTDGHHPTFLRLLEEAFSSNAADVALVGPRTVTSTRGCRHQLWELDAPTRGGHLVVRRQAISWLRTFASHLNRIEAFAGRGIDLVFLSYLDLFLNRWLLPFDWRRIVGKRRFSGLIFQGQTAEGRLQRSWRRGMLAPWALLHSHLCPAVGTLNERGAEALAGFLGNKSVLVFPDVVREASDASVSKSRLLQEIRMRAGDRPILVLLGALDRRKGLQEFLHLAGRLPEASWFMVCAGQVCDHTLSHEAVRMLARIRAGDCCNLLLYDQWLADDEFDSLFSEATAVFAAYREWPNSSNLLTKAAQAGKPVLVSDSGLMARRVHRYQTGLAVPEGDVSAMADILVGGKLQSLASTPEFSEGCRKYCADHSIERLILLVGFLLQECHVVTA